MTKILIVEDNEMNLDMLSRRLLRRGFEVITAVDGKQGVQSAAEEMPDLILMDMSLPVMDGWEAAGRIKAMIATSAIPIIALTAHAMTGERNKALAAGCDDFDTKPIDLTRLLAKIEALLENPAQPIGAQARESSQPAFLAQVRHELRTPINAITGYSEMLLEDASLEGDKAFVTILQEIVALGARLQEEVNTLSEAAAEAATRDHLHRALHVPASVILQLCEDWLLDQATTVRPGVVADVQKIRAAAERFLRQIEKTADALAAKSALAASTGKTGFIDTPSNFPKLDEEPVANTPGENQSRILVIDDNEANCDVLARRLRRHRHKVVTAQSGAWALQMMETETFDLVLLDVTMPEMNGYEVLERLKADSRLRHIPVIMISALDQIEGVVRCIELGAEDYLQKPFNPILLQARVSACLRKKHLHDELVLANKNLSAEIEERQKAEQLLRENEEKMRRLAHHDPLTGLPNRAMLYERLNQALASAERHDTQLGLMLLDLDGFKAVNDAHGHAVGDQLLVALGQRLTESVRAIDTIARLGGDEFVVLLAEISGAEDASLVAMKLLLTIAEPAHLAVGEVSVGASLGIAVYPSDAVDGDTLLRFADAAMYRAKQSGRNTYCFYLDAAASVEKLSE